MNILPVVVCYFSENWIRTGLESFHKILPSKRILVVDNNPKLPGNIAEKKYIRSLPYVDVIRGKQEQHDHHLGHYDHGLAIDIAVEYCQSQNIDVMLHLEPDCYCFGPRWYYNLLQPIKDGLWMSGGDKYTFGPIHPTPSMWRIDKIPGSFQHGPKGKDLEDPMHDKLFDLQKLNDVNAVDYNAGRSHYYPSHWDTGLKNWFHFAKEGMTAHISMGDFIHFRGGTDNSKNTVRKQYKSVGIKEEPPFLPEINYKIL